MFGVNIYSVHLFFSDNSEGTGITLRDILIFVTGANQVPPMGFDQPLKIQFVEGHRLPSASTCSLTLHVPREIIEYGNFKEKFTLSILGAHGFGNV